MNPSANQTQTKRSSSRLLAQKDERDILNPKPFPFEYGGKTYDILPMPDSKLMRIGDALAEVSGVVAGIAELLESGASGLSLAAYIPQIIKIVIPCSSKIIAVALDIKDEEAAKIPLARRIEALKLILLAEDAPLLRKNWQELTAIFAPEPTVPNPTAEALEVTATQTTD